MFNGEIIFHKKDTEKVVLLHYKSERLNIKFGAEKALCTFLSCTKRPFVGERNNAQEDNFLAIL